MSDEWVEIRVDGRSLRVPRGRNLLVVLLEEGPRALRRSVRGEGRSALCAMGICHECRVRVDGRTAERACLLRCEAGLEVWTDG